MKYIQNNYTYAFRRDYSPVIKHGAVDNLQLYIDMNFPAINLRALCGDVRIFQPGYPRLMAPFFIVDSH